MPGFALILHRDGSAVPERIADRVRRSLGPDAPAPVHGAGGSWLLARGSGTGGCGGASVHVAFDGRLDDRASLEAILGQVPGTEPGGDHGRDVIGPADRDAHLLHAAYLRWGEECFEHLLGPFAAVIVDASRRSILCARDGLGDRSLVYRLSAGRFLVATRESFLIDHPEVSREVDEGTVARFFALLPAASGRTFFAELRELGAGAALTLAMDRAAGGPPRFRHHWRPEPRATLRYRRDDEYGEHFREVLAASVRDRLAPDGGGAVLMSGGLDSTAVAALAAREMGGKGRALTTVSWIFDALSRADEREFMEPTVERLGAQPVWIRGDDDWPLAGCLEEPEHHVGGGTPYAAVYRRLRDRAYREVGARGERVLLTGECGDQLFLGAESWLRDLLAERRIGTAVSQVLNQVLGTASGAHRGDRVGIRSSVASVLSSWGGRPGSSSRGEGPADGQIGRPWLTTGAHRLVSDSPVPADAEWSTRRPEQAAAILDPRIAVAARQEAARAERWGIEVRRPYRDRRLVELALALPAHQLYRPGWGKWLTRRSMRGLLPETVCRRRRRSSLYPLFRRGVVEQEQAAVRALLDSPRAWWPRYVRPSWLWGFYPERVSDEVDGAGALVLWQCLALELWRRRVEGLTQGDELFRVQRSLAG